MKASRAPASRNRSGMYMNGFGKYSGLWCRACIPTATLVPAVKGTESITQSRAQRLKKTPGAGGVILMASLRQASRYVHRSKSGP